jgi:hypothetical protein
MTIDFLLKYKQKYVDNAKAFKKIFGVPLKPYWGTLGLDVFGLDDFVKPNEGESTNEAVLRQFGQSGVDLIHKLL